MKFRPVAVSNSTTRALTIFTALFPFKLKYQTRARVCQEASGIRRYSSRPIHSRRRGGDGRNPEFLRGRGSQRGEFQLGSSGRAGQAKSLIEDEAELSDWVSDLKMDSIRLSSDSDDLDDRSRSRDRNSPRNRTGMVRERFSSSKRQGDSDSDDFLGGGRNVSSRSSGGLRNSRVSVLKRRFDSEPESEDDGFSSRKRKEYGSRRDGLSSFAERGGRRFGVNNRRGQERGSLERGGRGLERQSLRFLDDEEEEEDNGDEDEMSAMEDSEDKTGSGKGASSLSEMVRESVQSTPKPSSRNSDSYLSETRYVRVQQLLAF